MRTIKFRVFFKCQNKMVSLSNLANEEIAVLCVDISGKVMIKEAFSPFYELTEEDAVVMSYTGLKDKNNIEIYEGDIVKCRGYGGMILAQVAWSNKHACFNIGEHGGSSTNRRPMLLQKKAEVLGNIYENPELLP